MKSISKVLVIALSAAAVVAALTLTNNLARPRRFAEVETGRLYRGSFPTIDELRSMRDDLGVRTVMSLTDDDGRNAPIKKEQPAVESLGMRFYRFSMPGDGRGSFEALDAAADQLASTAEHPVFFHCAAGKQRSNAALAAYRMKHCGWTLARALAELEAHGLHRTEEAELCEHLRLYSLHVAAAATRPASSE